YIQSSTLQEILIWPGALRERRGSLAGHLCENKAQAHAPKVLSLSSLSLLLNLRCDLSVLEVTTDQGVGSVFHQGYLQNLKITTKIQQETKRRKRQHFWGVSFENSTTGVWGFPGYHADATNVEIRLYLGGNQVGVVVGGREVIGENEGGGAYVADERAI
ncbi:hypothetical protein E4U31_006902, partial [Claviceps sp. LM219 group G6]